MLKKIAIALAAVVVVLAGVIVSRPDTFRLERSAVIAAPPAVVFPMVDDFHNWAAWSPWEKLDPGMKRTFSGPAAGTGAQYAWAGNDQVGEGRMTIVESQPESRIGIKLEFLKPWAATNDTLFVFSPDATGTRVSWTMEGRNNFMAKAFSLFASMESMVGPDFEKGLAAMKSAAEAEARRPAADPAESKPAS